MSVEISTLENGLRVVTDPRPGFETASVGVWVDVGARYESAELNGIAHMLEHMAFKGTASRSAQDIAEEIEAVGGHLNAYTGREHTAYFARVLRQDVRLGVDILSDILQRSAFDPEELERERTVILQEIGQAEDTPDDIIFDHLQEIAYPDQPLGRAILGTSERVANMPRDSLTGFMQRHYQGSRMVLCSAGGVKHEEMVALASEMFADLPNRPDSPLETATYAGGDFRDSRSLEQVHLTMAFPGLAYDDDDFYVMQVLSTLFGGGMSSRLFQEIRERRGLCYSIFSFASSYVDGGLFGIYAGTGEDELDQLVDVIGDELLKLSLGVTDAEVDRGRAQLKAGTLMSLESSSARAEQLARQLLIFGRPVPLEELVRRIDAVDADAVVRLAGRLSKGRPAVAAMGPIAKLASYDDIAAKFV